MSIDNIRARIKYGEYYKESKVNFITLLQEYKQQGKRVAIWGSGLKGTSFLQIMDKTATYIDCVIDMNQKFHGMTTQQGHPIVSPQDACNKQVDVIIVMNEVFYVEIYLQLTHMNYTGLILDADRIVKERISYEQILTGQMTQESEEKDPTLYGYTMKEIQQKVFLVLEEVDRICRQYHITYFLEAGSALGVQRYGGFIPCDDDIDIAMLREEYDRFLHIAPTELKEQFILQTMQKGSQYPYPYAQVVLNHTCFVRPQFKHVKMHHGVHIDIAPLDNVPVETIARQTQIAKVRHYTSMIRKKCVPELFQGTNLIKKWIVNYEYYLLQLVPLAYLRNKLQREMTRYNTGETGMVGDLCTHYQKDISFMKEILLPPITRSFETRDFPTPNQLERYLKVIYDDYKQISPRESGNTKYTLEEVSLEHNYKE